MGTEESPTPSPRRRIITDVPLEFRFETDGSLLVAGDDEAIDALESSSDPIPT